MTLSGLFFAQVVIYAFVPFYLALLKPPLRVAAFYVYLGILLVLASFMGSVYSIPIAPSISISGGNLAYGALLMSTVLLVIIERDIGSVRRVMQLVIAVSIFTLMLFAILVLLLSHNEILTPYGAMVNVFALSLPIIVIGSTMTIVELVILLGLFELIKRRVSNVTVVSTLYTLAFIAVLCIDGLLFPQIMRFLNPELISIVVGDFLSKLLLGISYSIPMLIFLLFFRTSLSEFVEKPMTLAEMLRAPQERLVEEIRRQRASLALGEVQLRDFAQRMALATEAAGLGVWDLDLATKQLVWDARSYEMFGVQPDTPMTLDRWATCLHPDDRPTAQAAYENALLTGTAYHTQYRVLHPDGQLRYVEAHATIQCDADGTPKRAIGINWDITQRTLLAIENEQLTAQFYQAQRLESIGRLAGGIAHDFNNLLVPISSYAELGQRRTTAEDSTYTYFGRIKQAADRAAGLTRQILAFSRKQSMEMKVVDLNRIIMEFQYMIQRALGEDIELNLDLAPMSLSISADSGQIEQVLMNLVVNARDAMPNGGDLTIATGQRRFEAEDLANHEGALPGLYTTLMVRDSGTGMDEVTKQRVFEPFFTTKPIGQGTGLGLATVFGIVKQHQGTIEFESEVGKGTTFTVFLPAAE
jgi:signal transduction histidine kinase